MTSTSIYIYIYIFIFIYNISHIYIHILYILQLVVNDTSNVSNPMNKSYYNNPTENITSTNHSAGLQIVMCQCWKQLTRQYK